MRPELRSLPNSVPSLNQKGNEIEKHPCGTGLLSGKSVNGCVHLSAPPQDGAMVTPA
jgi:hypothetical protein